MMIHFLLFTLIANVHSWTFISTHTNVVPKLTTDVTLKCFDDGVSQKSPLVAVHRIRILKFDNSSGDWRTFVVKGINTVFNKAKHAASGISASGNVGKPSASFLSVTWPVALKDTVGSYQCEIVAFDEQDTLHIYKTMTVTITSTSISLKDLLDIAIGMKKQIKALQEVTNGTENNHESMERLTTNQKSIMEGLQALEMKQDAVNSTLTNLFPSFQRKIEDNYIEVRNWPISPSAIPAPEGGCPQTQADTWVQGYINISAISDMGWRVSAQNHLAKPVLTTKYLSLGFCQRDYQYTNIVRWPKGSYCIYAMKQSYCPYRFTKNSMTITSLLAVLSPINAITVAKADNPYFRSSGPNFTLYFCCRNDSDADRPILLPTNQPFYLYRYKGMCQSVANTKVTGEWMEMVTNHDHYRTHYSDTDIHPDGNAVRARVEMCYYQGEPGS